jgi:hypothetical protein
MPTQFTQLLSEAVELGQQVPLLVQMVQILFLVQSRLRQSEAAAVRLTAVHTTAHLVALEVVALLRVLEALELQDKVMLVVMLEEA